MKSFEIYEHPNLGTQAIKLGFSWPAFFFGFWWSLVKKLWLSALLYFIAFLILNTLATGFNLAGQSGPELFVLLLMIGLSIIWGVNGNKWRANNLKKRGFELKQSTQAESDDAALANFSRGS